MVGEWTGFGKVSHQDGCYYEGSFLDNLKHGLGVYVSSDRSIYNGAFQYDRVFGKGKMMYLNGSIYWGYWFCNWQSSMEEAMLL